MKVAKLVSVELTTRVTVDDIMTDEEIVIAARERLVTKCNNYELIENLVEVVEDTEMPITEIEAWIANTLAERGVKSVSFELSNIIKCEYGYALTTLRDAAAKEGKQ